MPTPGENVILNPDWSDRDGTGSSVQARWWHTTWTWEPLLSWGTGHFYDVDADNSMRVQFFNSTEIDPVDGYPGLLYGGPGFDASPGDTWHIEFAASRPAASTGYGRSNDDILVRFGISVPDGDQFIAYYMDLYLAALAPSSSILYSADFEIPSNWPEGQYQFAICKVGDPDLPPFVYPGSPTTEPYFPGFTLELSDVSLEFVSSGVGSPGSAGVFNPFAHWPMPQWSVDDPLWPSPPYITWDSDPVFRAPLLDAEATFGPNPDSGIYGPLTKGWVSFGQTNALGSPGPIYARIALSPTEWVLIGGLSFMAISTYDETEKFWSPFYSVFCDPEWEALGQAYWEVPKRAVWRSGFPFGSNFWQDIEPWGTLLVPPSWIAPHPGIQYLGYTPVPPVAQQFFMENTCEPPTPGAPGEPVYLTHEVSPGDANIPAGGSGALNLRAIRAAAGDGSGAGTGSGGLHLGGVKGQP